MVISWQGNFARLHFLSYGSIIADESDIRTYLILVLSDNIIGGSQYIQPIQGYCTSTQHDLSKLPSLVGIRTLTHFSRNHFNIKSFKEFVVPFSEPSCIVIWNHKIFCSLLMALSEFDDSGSSREFSVRIV
ncbi:unnamed protein product [Onchocerca flexuosa]|uniref:CUB domain-containing protein n=1 Tax=Onchocerca flexuosa TaxID=387005 RepID=A0A183I2E4_9BILA|nr:unnamed protein product [Onchocerca flexuosa]